MSEDKQAQFVVDIIKHNTTITALNLHAISFSHKAGFVAKALATSQRIKKFWLTGNFTKDIFNDFATLLQSNVIEFLYFYDTSKNQYNMTTFIDALKVNTSLEELQINFMLRSAAPERLARLFEGNKTLKKWTLTEEAPEPESAIPLFMGLGKNDAIRQLHLRVKLKSSTISYLTIMLVNNKTITHLELYYLDEQAVIFLLSSLRLNCTLLSLDIRLSSIKDEAAEVLADYLKHNVSLTHLWIISCEISDSCAQLIFQAINHNKALRYLNITDNNFGDSYTARSIVECLQNNKNIAELRVDGFEAMDDYLKTALVQFPAFIPLN